MTESTYYYYRNDQLANTFKSLEVAMKHYDGQCDTYPDMSHVVVRVDQTPIAHFENGKHKVV